MYNIVLLNKGGNRAETEGSHFAISDIWFLKFIIWYNSSIFSQHQH